MALTYDFPVNTELSGDVTKGEFKTALIQWLYANRRQLGGRPYAGQTIASGSITPGRAYTVVDTEGAASSDNLTNVVYTKLSEGTVLVLTQKDDSRIITLKHAAGGLGELLLPDGSDIVLADSFDGVALIRIGTQWKFMFRLSGLPSSYAHHGVKVITGPATGTFTHPDGGLSELKVIGYGASGGGGGGGDSSGPNDGSDGVDAVDSTITDFYSTLQYIRGGGKGGGGKGAGTDPSAASKGLLPVGAVGGQWEEYTLYSKGGTGAGTATGGASGQKGEDLVGQVKYGYITYDLKAGGAGGAGGGSGTVGSSGRPARLVIIY